MNGNKLKDRFRGCMVGLAIGDALGAACEGMKERQVREIYGILRDYQTTPYFDAGEFTDDTCMALAIAESMIECECVDTEVIADAFVEWMNKDGRGIGLLTLDALRMIQDGESPSEAGMRAWEKSGRGSAGNGAVMRCAPIGLLDSFEDGIIAVVNKGGDADTNGAVAGALLGAKCGYEQLPPRWVKGLWERERVLAAADGLYDLSYS